MRYFDVIILSDVISSIGPKISDCDTYNEHIYPISNRYLAHMTNINVKVIPIQNILIHLRRSHYGYSSLPQH